MGGSEATVAVAALYAQKKGDSVESQEKRVGKAK